MTAQPDNIADLQEAVCTHERLRIRGRGTKSSPEAERERVTLDISGLTGIIEYSPEECVFTAWAGTPLADITALLAQQGQYLPFDPPLLEAGATIGGTVAAGLSGSERYRYGGVRDFIIGVRIVDGEGRLIRSGGKVVKNAAGFLLHHGMVGSLGRFGVLAELTFKVFPAPESRATLRVRCESLPYAVDTLHAIERTRCDVAALDFDDSGTLWIRVAGSRAALATRVDKLQRAVPFAVDRLGDVEDEQFWTDAREFRWATGAALVKIPGPRLSDWAGSADWGTLRDSLTAARFACGGSVAWVAVDDPAAFSTRLAAAGLSGLVVRGAMAGARIGLTPSNSFEEHVRSVLDPRRRFS